MNGKAFFLFSSEKRNQREYKKRVMSASEEIRAIFVLLSFLLPHFLTFKFAGEESSHS
jgi:hypothetical protein